MIESRVFIFVFLILEPHYQNYIMTNKQIAKSFQLLGQLMELHGENPYKIRSYDKAYRTLRSWERPLIEMNADEIAAIPGVGKAILEKISELLKDGEMKTLERYRAQTPEGIQEMMDIKGFGAKKVRTIWRDLKIESVGELLYAVNENRLTELKGFGTKTQADLKQKLEYFQQSKHQYHYAKLESLAERIVQKLRSLLPKARVELTGAVRRKMPILATIEILIATDEDISELLLSHFEVVKTGEDKVLILKEEGSTAPIKIYICTHQSFGNQQVIRTGSKAFTDSFFQLSNEQLIDMDNEAKLFEQVGLPFLPPELRDDPDNLTLKSIPSLIVAENIRGALHVHTTFSDGAHTLAEMANCAKDLGYEYIGITDHSKSAFYANGLKIDRLEDQWQAIDELNESLSPFKIFKGIESDILADGSLDYEDEILAQFDFIIASIHSNLKMDEQKATQRLINAIENPHTKILGHPTGRLLLSRQGYPINHIAVIDACAANGVAIELNANPYRLDLDWTWIPYALEKEVYIAINPDAHSKSGIHDIHYGLQVARKGLLTKEMCLNAMNLADFSKWLKS